MTKPKKATASNTTVKRQITKLIGLNNDLTIQRDAMLEENKALKKQLAESNNMWEVEVKRDDIARIKSISDYSQNELEDLSPEELTRLLDAMTRVKGASKTSYKSIRTTGDADRKGRLTVGSTFGKTYEEILAMGGEH